MSLGVCTKILRKCLPRKNYTVKMQFVTFRENVHIYYTIGLRGQSVCLWACVTVGGKL